MHGMIRVCLVLVFPHQYYIKHVNMCIVLMTNRAVYDNETKAWPQACQLCIQTMVICSPVHNTFIKKQTSNIAANKVV